MGYKSIINITLANANMYVYAPLVLQPIYTNSNCIAILQLLRLECLKTIKTLLLI